MKSNYKNIILSIGILCLCAGFASVSLAEDPEWTLISNASDITNFFIKSGEWKAINKDSTIPVYTESYLTLPSDMVSRALNTITNTLPNPPKLASDDPHLSASGELYAWNQFTVNLLNQDCGNQNEVGYFTYKIDEGTSKIYMGECGILFKVVNGKDGEPLGTGYRVRFKQKYGDYVRVAFWVRNKQLKGTQYSAGTPSAYSNTRTDPLRYTLFSVETINKIPGKPWYDSKTNITNPAHYNFSYIFDTSTSRSLFPESSRPVIFAFEDSFSKSSDWDYNDVAFVCGPVFREYEIDTPPISSISGVAWLDINQDGLYDSATEPFMPGMTIDLLDEQGVVVDTTTTDIGGTYRFPEIADVGTFFIRINTEDRWNISERVESITQHYNRFYPDTQITDPLVLEGDTHLYRIDVGLSAIQPEIDC